MSGYENESVNFELELPGPDIGSLWLYPHYNDDGFTYDFTVLEIKHWSRYGTGPRGSVDMRFWSHNGSTDNRYSQVVEVPNELQRMTIDDFWELVETGQLKHLEVEQKRQIRPSEPIFQPGDVIHGSGQSDGPVVE
jgi:hypothetical protein